MLREQFRQFKEKFIRPQAIDLAQRLLDEKFQNLELSNQEIEVFGVDFLKSQMGDEPIRNLKIAKMLGQERAEAFKVNVIESMGDLGDSRVMKNRLQGILAYGALKITREVLNDSDLSYRKKKRKLVFLETFLNENGIVSEHSKLLVREGKREVKKQEIVKNLITGAKFVFGTALGFFGADLAEKYVAFMPAAQEALGLAVVVATSGSRIATRLLSEKSPKFKKIDRVLANIQPVLIGIGVGITGHGLYDHFNNQVEQVVKEVGRLSTRHISPVQAHSHPVTPTPEISSASAQAIGTAKYTVSGAEPGGLTDILASFHQDPYGQEITNFILQNKDVLTDSSRNGHEAAIKLIQFLQQNPNYTWRDAMNESSRQGHATEVSKLFTEALKFIRPGTIFSIPVQ